MEQVDSDTVPILYAIEDYPANDGSHHGNLFNAAGCYCW